MAVTSFGTNDDQTVKLWSSLTLREALKATMFTKIMGTGNRAVLQKMSELEKSAGDTIKYDLLMQMTGAGVKGDNRMRDNEEPLVYYQDSFMIDQLRNAHAFRRMSQQMTLHNLRSDAKSNLADWFAGTFDDYMFRTLCGDTTFAFANTPAAPEATHTIWSGDATTQASVGSNDQFTLADIDYCVELAKTLTPPIRPTNAAGKDMFVVVLHPYSITDLKLDIGNSAYVDWPTIQMMANKRGQSNPLFTGAIGIYNNVVIWESTRIYSPATSVRNNLFLGAQAGVFGMGGAYQGIDKARSGTGNLMSWYEEIDDYGNEKGISVGAIFGMNKSQFNSLDYGMITIQTYAAAHT